jgi:NADPH:quinone reductase
MLTKLTCLPGLRWYFKNKIMNQQDKMKALTISAYNSNLIRAMQGIKMEEREMPLPGAGEVMVKVLLAAVNPSDIAFLRGGYNIIKTLPAIPGFEGAGVIVKTGRGVDEKLIGRRVSFFSQSDKGGTWAEYVVIGQSDFILAGDIIPDEQAACLFVNPFTAKGMLDHVHNNGHQALIQSAAMGQVGKFIRFFAAEHDMQVINLVRKEQHVEELSAQGERYVLNITAEDFPDALRRMAADTGATAALDVVGGELTGKILNAMPAGAEVILYGGLSGAAVGSISPLEVIFKNKVLWGFNLGDWLQALDAKERTSVSQQIIHLFEQKKLETKISQIVALEQYYDGLRSYISNMSAGKVLFKISD